MEFIYRHVNLIKSSPSSDLIIRLSDVCQRIFTFTPADPRVEIHAVRTFVSLLNAFISVLLQESAESSFSFTI